MTHMYFSARAERRISYGHLGRTDSCLLLSFFLFFVCYYQIGEIKLYIYIGPPRLYRPRPRPRAPSETTSGLKIWERWLAHRPLWHGMPHIIEALPPSRELQCQVWSLLSNAIKRPLRTAFQGHTDRTVTNDFLYNQLCERPPQYYVPPPASWPLTFWTWKWCPSHVWLPLCQFQSS